MSTSKSLAGGANSQAARSSDTRSSALMAAGTLVSRVLGFVKSWLLVAAIGLGSTVTDTFINANNLPNLVFLLVAGGVFNAVLVPQIIKASRAADRGADYVSRLLTLGVLAMASLTVLVTLCAPLLMRLTTSNYSEAQMQLAVTFAWFCLPQIFFYGLYALLTQVLNANGAFAPAMWAPIVNNIVAIIGLGMFIVMFGSGASNPHNLQTWTPTQTVLVAGFSTLGVVAQTLVLLIPVRRLRLGLRPRFGWRGVGLGQAARLGMWTLLTAAVSQLSFLYVMKIASIPSGARAAAGPDGPPIAGNTVLEVASQLYLLPHSIIALSLATVLFNRMTQASLNQDRRGLRSALSHGLRTMAIATVFSAVVLLVLAGPLGMFFSGGVPQDGAMLAITLSILALSTPFMSANFMMARVFYAREDARTPFYIQTMLSVVNVVGAFVIAFLPPASIIYAIAVLYTVGNILSVVISAIFLRRLLGHLDGPRVINSYIRMGYAAVGSAVAGGLALWLLGGYRPDGFVWSSRIAALVTIIVVGPVMLAAYILLLRVLHVSELRDLLRPLLGRFIKPGTTAAASVSGLPAQDEGQAPDAGLGNSAQAGSGASMTGAASRTAGGSAGDSQQPGSASSSVPVPAPQTATISLDTGLMPRISGEFDANSYRMGPSAEDLDPQPSDRTARSLPGSASGAAESALGLLGRFRAWLWQPEEKIPHGRHSFEGKDGANPHFPEDLR